MRTWCGTCGTPIDPARQFCATCGVFVAEGFWAPPLNALVCKRCGAANAPERTDCGRCNTNLLTGMDPYCGQVYLAGREHQPTVREDATMQADRDPSACPSCGTVNPDATVFCGTCGRFLDWEHGPDGSRTQLPSAPTEAT